MFKIIVNFLETKNWEKSLMDVLPPRKFNQDKNSTSENHDHSNLENKITEKSNDDHDHSNLENKIN